MSSAWLKFKVWTKLAIFFVVLLYLLVFVAKNSGQPVRFWYWYNRQWDTSLLYFTFFTFIAGVVVAVLMRTIFKTIGQFREMQRRSEQERKDRELRELQAKAAMLQQRPGLVSEATASPPAAMAERPPADVSPPAPGA
jgi:uncharacterized integral membrane protein